MLGGVVRAYYLVMRKDVRMPAAVRHWLGISPPDIAQKLRGSRISATSQELDA